MNSKIRSCLLALAAAGLAAFVFLNVLAYNHAVSMTHFIASGPPTTQKPERLAAWNKLEVLVTGIRVNRPACSGAPADLAPRCQKLRISGPDCATLSAWFCEGGKASPLVVMFHGYAKEKAFLIPEAKAFLQLGASVLLVDFQGSGDSTGNDTTIGMREARDVAAAVRYAGGHLPHARLVLYGQSLGAVAILRAVYDRAVTPDAVLLEGVFDTLLNTVRNRFSSMGVPSFPNAELLVFWGGVQFGFNGFAHKPVDYAKALKCPLLVMHGSEDRRVSVPEARRVFEAAPEPKAFKLFEGVSHESYVSRRSEEWLATVGPFLKALEAQP